MTLYLSFYFGSVFFFIFSSDKYFKIIGNKIIFWGIFIILLLFAGFRYGIATDYWNYYALFRKKEGIQRIEPGFLSFIRIYKLIFGETASYNGFVFLVSLISILVKYFYFRKLKTPFLALVIYIALFYISLEYNVIRHGLAISLIFYAVHYAQQKKAILFFTLILVATTIHISSALFLPLYFFCTKRSHWKLSTTIFLIIITLFIRLFILDYILSKIVPIFGYIGSAMAAQLRIYLMVSDFIITTGFIRRFAIIALFIFLNKENHVANCFFNLYLIGFLLYILFMGNDIFAHRISLCFDIFAIPLFASIKTRRTLKNIIALIVLVVLLFITYWYPLSTGYAIPYQTYLSL